ncbi:hypothetical protein [Nocardioides zeae]|uniref:hypothetical protein n=1 Tax=Nocardioides zeae TaxID=1457234 RepID=UPI0027D7FA46|nr:hypothetical protein [Nocardioides zeae]
MPGSPLSPAAAPGCCSTWSTSPTWVPRWYAACSAPGRGPTTLARAAYGPPGSAEPGHPVLLGAAHVAGVRASAVGDRGARGYLADRDVRLVDCADLATGRDVDRR